ncbi:uncharacterized protein CANTADRAFT_26973 [Suhomyces tanzawaensis NRRL Y-17324]|uniref:Uncharacterized protein n=1 Tax=Suhomyces tanzawaensis NRRL Y-17324 TaxID=984487 RepID=A0A1E4SET0_9ASCO|nr:uncharacterized protein CANTADRAFT_26973 [Suhomyces tanzawaensis NRRL Y-17324]ODV78015.1 hypothetical protein CANTADRAFT_26973 [Suhomyces tanzawaensis NRRL Y-17324]
MQSAEYNRGCNALGTTVECTWTLSPTDHLQYQDSTPEDSNSRALIQVSSFEPYFS